MTKIEVIQGDITQQPDIDAIVNAANDVLEPGGGVCGAVYRAAGVDKLDRAVKYLYEGDDGVVLGSGVNGFLRKSAFSLRFGDINPMVSGNIRPDSRVLLERDVTSRVKAVAPFLAYDHDPYAVVPLVPRDPSADAGATFTKFVESF